MSMEARLNIFVAGEPVRQSLITTSNNINGVTIVHAVICLVICVGLFIIFKFTAVLHECITLISNSFSCSNC